MRITRISLPTAAFPLLFLLLAVLCSSVSTGSMERSMDSSSAATILPKHRYVANNYEEVPSYPGGLKETKIWVPVKNLKFGISYKIQF